jgi:hypothetical protein
VNDHLGNETTPSSKWWDGTPSMLDINTISETGPVMNFNVTV